MALGRSFEAEVVYRKAVTGLSNLQDEGSYIAANETEQPALVVALLDLAGACEVNGKVTEAVNCYQKTIEALEESGRGTRGAPASLLFTALLGLGGALRREGRLVEGKGALTRALAIEVSLHMPVESNPPFVILCL